MDIKILVSVDEFETRVAVLENSVLSEVLFERTAHRRKAGNLYKGRVCSIIPGMQAAFVDIGLGRNAFLYVADAAPPSVNDMKEMAEKEELEDDEDDALLLDAEDEDEDEDEDLEEDFLEGTYLPKASIEDLMKEGQEILVQLEKEPIGAKGARVTANVSLPGRFVVLLPNSTHIGVSRRITCPEEKSRLREMGQEITPEGYGLILRTAALGATIEKLGEDLQALLRVNEKIQKAFSDSKAPALLHRELGLAQRILRDSFIEDSIEVVIDDEELYNELRQSAELIRPDLDCCFTLYEGRTRMFQAMNIETKIEKLLDRKVWLNCGGYIVIDETEALTAIDVNTGRYIGESDLEQTVLKANMEAAEEIAHQIRLRNIGGIIIIDFIDMKQSKNWDSVVAKLESILERDRAYTRVLGVTDLGLVEMTRKRVHKSLSRSLCQPCPYCKREGLILSLRTMMINVLRKVETLCHQQSGASLIMHVHPEVAGGIEQEYSEFLEELENSTGKRVEIVGNEKLHFEDMKQKSSSETSENI